MTKCNMKILAIETSCDETAASVVAKNPKENYVKVLSNVVASSLILHSKTGGIIPDIAAREQLKFIIPVIEKAIENCKLKIENLDAIAVTYGPGLIGSLLIGVETAKTLSYLWNKPIIPVNHLFGHIYANWIYPQSSVLGSQLSDSSQSVHQLTGKLKTDKLESENRQQKTDNRILFPAITLLVSGGHTDLLLMENHNNFKWLGGTLDDAAGEAFDKIGRLLNLPYPAGPTMEALAKNGNSKAFTFPRPMIGSKDFDFSFSGLKAAAMREVIKLKKGVAKEEGRPDNAQRREHWREGLLLTGPQLKKEVIVDICASVQKSIIEVLVRKTLKAAKKYNVKSILLGGGVTANQKLRDELIHNTKYLIPDTEIFFPKKFLCTDNAAMIGAYAAFHPEEMSWNKITANPELYFE